MEIYIHVNDETKGPFSRADVLDGLKHGAFSKQDLCAQEGWEEWKTLGEVFKERPVVPVSDKKPKKQKKPVPPKKDWRSEKITPKQRSYLKKLGKKPPKTKGEASDMINAITSPPATPRQMAKLEFLKLPSNVSRRKAGDVIDEIELDPEWAERLAMWDRKKTQLHPQLYWPDGTYRDDNGGKKISLSGIFLLIVLGVLFYALVRSLF